MATLKISVSALPTRIDVTVLAGEPFELAVPVLDGAGDPVAAGGIASARAQVRPDVASGQVLHLFSTADPATAEITGTTAASVVLTASSDETSLWQEDWPGCAPRTVVWWDLEVTDADGVAHQITSPGTITLVHQVTR